MRCLSPLAAYSIQVIEGEEQVVVDARGYATSHVLKKPIIADFERSGLLDHEIEAALERFNFSGLPDGVNPLTRISCFDTEAYVQRYPENQRDEMLIQIDQRLREKQQLFPSEFIIVEPPISPIPWPSYDTDGIEDVLKIQERLDPKGTLATAIRKYEEENAARPEVINAMLRIENPDFEPAPEGQEQAPIQVEA